MLSVHWISSYRNLSLRRSLTVCITPLAMIMPPTMPMIATITSAISLGICGPLSSLGTTQPTGVGVLYPAGRGVLEATNGLAVLVAVSVGKGVAE